MKTYERLLNYVKINTNSDESNPNCPSSENQWELAKQLKEEMQSIGISDVRIDENCYVYGRIPAKGIGYKNKIGFISHMDTSPACPGGPIKARIIKNYDGKIITLENGIEINPEEYDFLEKLVSEDLIVTDGNTLLGADNKAGISIIMTMCEEIINSSDDHCEILIGFTPDEEIGRGADLFNVNDFGADFAFTIDGGELGEIEYENFNAASAVVHIKGVNIHPGYAKGKLINSTKIACKFDTLIPEFERPEYTQDYEGFYHLVEIKGSEEYTKLTYIIRDHDMNLFETKKQKLLNIAEFLNKQYGQELVSVDIKDSYYNMKEKVLEKPYVLDIAEKAYIDAGIKPVYKAIRGGTDGSRLSFMGLVCPNLSTGGYNFHSRKELVSINAMDKMVEVLKNIVKHK